MKNPKPVGINVVDFTTVIKWDDGTITSVACQPEDTFSPEHGVLWAIAKKFIEVEKVNKMIGVARSITGE